MWTQADALEWIRRQGITAVHYRKEAYHHVFFEKFDDEWPADPVREERVVAERSDLGISFVYRSYPTKQRLYDRETRGGETLVRCFKFYHGQRIFGRPVE